jgi:glycerophosphoryl diester phosphodiesterase
VKRVGHKGADEIAPGNTPASFDAARDTGVDMIEFDVLPADHEDPGGSALLLAHDYRDARKRTPTTLGEGLAHLAGSAFAGLDFDVDLKLPGYEDRVVAALREHGLVERSLVSSQYRASLARVRELEPALRRGWSVPKASRDYTKSKLYAVPAYAALRVFRAALPRRAAAAVAGGEVTAVMAHWLVVSPALVRAVERAGGEVYVWTVDELDRIRRMRDLGVTGVITNDPRLFAQLAAAPATP